ncbi:hypothetical protein [Pseudofrankia inefficax]|uniref:Uncharacterized protein n=1 Tax=Pseudofrankia inefficax (strain DSM 45817 / CECT 9037 / DDB 130130 / EuI1c) TaxID=298654 RepID=E3IVZ9_PSEI1|nr:hypothetical protein [Pseudofrankia inefficax]ADP84927.1 hypothetical protein FraEuI1c_6959 [Pseudofrankia inefficax]
MPTPPENPDGVVPRAEIHLDINPPDDFTYQVPIPDDLDTDEWDEGGTGYFHHTWRISGVTREQAAQVIRAESALVRLLATTATSPAEFDDLARELEESTADDSTWLDEESNPDAANVDITELAGLEIGVSGLVHVIAAIGGWPAASCRGHINEPIWADWPVVYFAATEDLVREMGPSVAESGCGFSNDPDRPELLILEGPSILEIMMLAERLLEAERSSGLAQGRPGDR